jgi:5-methylcytosine-specific restriction enzyme A
MMISELPALVTASKADWLPGTTWIGFTPTGTGYDAHAQCQSTIQRQFGNGYVIEYVTEQFSDPNPGFEDDPTYLANREAHQEVAGRFVAIHRLRTSSRPLHEIIGDEEFEHLQDMWSHDNERRRWSVAFPIIESYRIPDKPKAKDVLGDEGYRRLYHHASATLRELTDEERTSIESLHIEYVSTTNAWIGIEDEIGFAEGSDISSVTLQLMEDDITDAALEGIEAERKVKIRRRAAWIAERFIRERRRAGTLFCDDCGMKPEDRIDAELISPRSVLDVHHKHPLEEGIRYTTTADFALLCPTCHRIEHLRLNVE